MAETKTATERLRRIAVILEAVDARCLAADGPVPKTRELITDDELREIYLLATRFQPVRARVVAEHMPKPILDHLMAHPNTWIADLFGLTVGAVRQWRKRMGYEVACGRGGAPRAGRQALETWWKRVSEADEKAG